MDAINFFQYQLYTYKRLLLSVCEQEKAEEASLLCFWSPRRLTDVQDSASSFLHVEKKPLLKQLNSAINIVEIHIYDGVNFTKA